MLVDEPFAALDSKTASVSKHRSNRQHRGWRAGHRSLRRSDLGPMPSDLYTQGRACAFLGFSRRSRGTRRFVIPTWERTIVGNASVIRTQFLSGRTSEKSG